MPGLLSVVLGWTYTLLWSVSFYPQVVQNYATKSVRGVSSEFLVLNVVGHGLYAFATFSHLLWGAVRGEYARRHAGRSAAVAWNDAAFAGHAALLASVTAGQRLVYGGERVPRRLLASAAALLASVVATAALATPLDAVNAAASIKVAITAVKYLVVLNYTRRSTAGFSVENVALDAAGGVLSLAQLALDAPDWDSVLGNPGKLGLAVLSIAYDMVLIAQHVYYTHTHTRGHARGRGRGRGEGEREPLLA